MKKTKYIFVLWLFLSVPAQIAQAQGKFKVGVILPLSGELAEYGVAEKNGFEMAKKEHAELFENVDFVYEDPRYDNVVALSIFNKLKSEGDVNLIYLWGYGVNQAVVPIAESHKFPLLACTAEQALAKGRKYIIVGYAFYTRQAAQVLLDYLRTKGLKHFGIVKTELAFTNSVFDEMKQNLRADETLELVDTFGFNDSDFRVSITELRNRKYDAIGVFLLSGQVSQFYNQMAQLHFKASTFGTDFFDSINVIQRAKGNMEGAVFEAPYFVREFANRYMTEYGNDVQVAWATHSYEFALLTARLFGNESRKLSAEEILDKYRKAGKQTGVTDEYEYKDASDGAGFSFRVTAKRVEKDSIVQIGP